MYVNFGDISRDRLEIQCQYGSRYVDGVIPGYPNLGKRLRFEGDCNNYHSLKIHIDDVEEFVKRYFEYIGAKLTVNNENVKKVLDKYGCEISH